MNILNHPILSMLILAASLGMSLPVHSAGNDGNGKATPKGTKATSVAAVRVVEVKGAVTIAVADKPATPLKQGAFLAKGSSVRTGANSTATLLFSNGTTITVRPNSVFLMDSFTQAPFDSTGIRYKDLKQEPSISNTRVTVSAGTIVANVAKLRKGSTMVIGTPAGVARVVGTIVQVTITRPGGGAQTVRISVPEGSVAFTALNGTTTTLSDGSTISVSAAAPGAQPTSLTPQEAAEIEALINEALAQLPPEGAFEGVPDGSPETGGTGEDGAGGFGGDQGAGNPGNPSGGSGGGSGGGGSSATPTPTPNPPPS